MYSVQRRLHREMTVGKIGLCLVTLPACQIRTSCKCLYYHSFLYKREFFMFCVMKVCLHVVMYKSFICLLTTEVIDSQVNSGSPPV